MKLRKYYNLNIALYVTLLLSCTNTSELSNTAHEVKYESKTTNTKSNAYIKWEKGQIINTVEIAENQTEYFISLGISSGEDQSMSFQNAKHEATFQIPEIVQLYIEAISQSHSIYFNDELQDEEYNNLIHLKSEINIKNLTYKKTGQHFLNGKYYTAVNAYLEKAQYRESYLKFICNSKSVREKEIEKLINRKFEEITKKKYNGNK